MNTLDIEDFMGEQVDISLKITALFLLVYVGFRLYNAGKLSAILNVVKEEITEL